MTYTLAIDYGTSFTTAAVAVDGAAARLVEVGGSQSQQFRLPSLVWVDGDGELVVGWEAERGAALAPGRLERAPKVHLGEAPLDLGRPVAVEEAAAAVLERVAGEARRQLGGAAPGVVRLTHPASWSNKRKAALREAARLAGLGEVELVAEPVAAARHLAGADVTAGGSVAVYDLGGGTVDCAVLRRRVDGDFDVVAVGGQDSLGGEVFDGLLVRELAAGLRQRDPDGWAAIEASGRALAKLRREARATKEALSVHAAYEVILPDEVARASVRFTRAELERVVGGDVERSLAIMVETIAAAGVEPAALKAVYLAGGASRMPIVARVLGERLGRVPDTREEPKSVVALGAATEPAPVEAPEPDVRPHEAPSAATGKQPKPRSTRDAGAIDLADLIERGWAAFDSDDFAAADESFRHALALGDVDQRAETLIALGMTAARRGDDDAAARLYEEAIACEHPVESPVAMNNLGALLEQRGEEDRAAECFREASASAATTDYIRELATNNLRNLEERQAARERESVANAHRVRQPSRAAELFADLGRGLLKVAFWVALLAGAVLGLQKTGAIPECDGTRYGPFGLRCAPEISPPPPTPRPPPTPIRPPTFNSP